VGLTQGEVYIANKDSHSIINPKISRGGQPMAQVQKLPIDCLLHSPCIEMQYYDQGAGETLILIHGLGEVKESWHLGIIERLSGCRA